MANKTYDILKYIAQIVLPAIATLYFALAGIWGLPYAEEVVGTITAIDTFLGAVLMISNSKYKKVGETDNCILEVYPDEDLRGVDDENK